jgi:hypothetical protein
MQRFVMELFSKMSKYLSILLIFSLMSCAPRRADLPAFYQSEGQKPVNAIVKNIEYDEQGRPVFSHILKERPTGEGEQFSLVQFANEKPARSFDIVVMPEHPDFSRPFKVIFEWTGKGFRAGVTSGKSYTDAVMTERKSNVTGVTKTGSEAIMAVGQVVILSIGGFVVGVAAGISATFQELSHYVVNAHEQVISYTVYEYDFRERINQMKTFLPTDISQEIIKTEFFYEGEGVVPSKTTITSYPENSIRTIP